jgi:chromosome segregation protein
MAHVKKLVIDGFKSFAKKTEIPFDRGINVIIGPNGSGKSCSYDTIVTLANGDEIELGKLIESKISDSNDIKELDDGVYVDGKGDVEIISLNKENMKAEKRVVSKFIKREGDILYEIKTRSGRELKATGCHPVMSFIDDEVKSRVISDLKIGSLVATPRLLDTGGKKVDERLARLMGYIIGDGYIANNRIEFVNNDPELLEDFKKIVLEFFNQNVKSRKEKNIERLFIYGKEIVDEIRSYFGEFEGPITTNKKKIPSFLLRSDRATVSNVLAGIYDTDGSVRKDIAVMELCTKNKDLARQIQSLLLRFGILSKVKKRTSFAYNTKDKIKRDYFYIYINGSENLKKFYKNIHLKCEHKLNILKFWFDNKVTLNTNVDLLPREINKDVREISKLLGIRTKNERRNYPLLAAYIEDRCLPSREGISRLCEFFENRLNDLLGDYKTIAMEQINLVNRMDNLGLSSKVVSEGIGLHSTIIRNQWATQDFTPRPKNLQGFFNFVRGVFEERLPRINELLELLRNVSNSDIFWDEIVSIEKLEKPEWVYDLTVEGNHNFIANNIFAHNSNISDALCFVLGRLSVKSMRAEKAKNLIFMGSKYVRPAKEASVELHFDNSDGAFAIDTKEIVIERTVRLKGQSIYKINGEVKTRAEIIETLGQAGIDPYGYNIILQGQIQSIVKMHPEDRRKIIGEVAGISVYEWRKEKSLKELEKTDARLKEISTVLRERTAYLNNLEKEKAQAQKYKELQLTVKRSKASILKRKHDDKMKEINSLVKTIEDKVGVKDKSREKAEKSQEELDSLSEKVNQINKQIREATGLEQGKLREEITNLRAELEGLRVRKEGYENRGEEIERRIEEMKKSIPELENEIKHLRDESPMMAKKASELRKKKEELAELEKEKKKAVLIRSELIAVKNTIQDRKHQLARVEADSEALVGRIEELSKDFEYHTEEECEEAIEFYKKKLTQEEDRLDSLREEELKNEKMISVSEVEIERNEEIKKKVEQIDVCPLCQSKMTQEHVNHVFGEADFKISKAHTNLQGAKENLERIKGSVGESIKKINELEGKIRISEKEFSLHKNVAEKKETLKKYVDGSAVIKKEINEFENRKTNLERKTEEISKIDELYGNKMLEIEEISSRTEEDIDTTLLYKERELEKTKSIIDRSKEDLEEVGGQIKNLGEGIESRQISLDKKENKEKELNLKFQKMFTERDATQKKYQEISIKLTEIQNEVRQIEDQINYLKVGKAKLDGERETIEMDLAEYTGVEILQGSINSLEEKLQRAQSTLETIGSINMRALEVYDEVKKEYDVVKEKVDTLEKEKIEILKIIEEIDKKKKKVFMKTFSAINGLFTENFSRLTTKGGAAYLEIENEEEMFEGGVDIVVKMARGKYFDVNSLSGGEQTLVALSLLFAIQEYKPYQFYILDEIDAALDKRNSERLAALLKRYMKSGQYIVVTHNDAIILDASVLYGVSMHEGVSKILSLKVSQKIEENNEKG